MFDVKELFLKYVKVNTQSDDKSMASPSTPGQRVLAEMVAEDCRKIGLTDVEVCSDGYVYATLEANVDGEVPVIGFIAHMDTSEDCSGENISPRIIESYDGEDIILESGLVISTNECSFLPNYKGQELITTDGHTLLGADNKAGIAEILAAMNFLISTPEIKHGKIKIGFTPDEEIGRGADKFNVKNFGAHFAYTIDGGEIGELTYESFNAARADIFIKGRSVHPGRAKGLMLNASLIALEIANMLPAGETPATTEKREGFFHLCEMNGTIENAYLEYLIRDFEDEGFNFRKDLILDAVLKMNEKYGECVTLNLYDQYYNMANVLKSKTHIIEIAEKAYEAVGVAVKKVPIRGGTDGSRLSYMGLPCPNIFAGGHNYHGPLEFIPVESMRKASEVIVKICEMVVCLKNII